MPESATTTGPEPPPVDTDSPVPASPSSAGRAVRRVLEPLRRVVPLLALAPLVAAMWFVNRFDPTDRTPDPTGPCLYHETTGLNGPGCGGTRMFYYLIHGDLVEAARNHLPALLAVPLVGYVWLRWALSRFGVELPRLRLPTWALIAYGVFFVVFTMVLRNLDWGPFAWFNIPYLTPALS